MGDCLFVIGYATLTFSQNTQVHLAEFLPVLTVKSYGFYVYRCSHYPQTKATVVAETPELVRLTQASKNQSQVNLFDTLSVNSSPVAVHISLG